MRKTRINLLALLVALALPGKLPADQSPALPARFADSPVSLENLVRFPAIDGDVFETLYCRVTVDYTGQLKKDICLATGSGQDEFHAAVHSALKSVAVSPAIVNDKPRRVYIHFRVRFEQENGERSVRVYPNWGFDTQKYGDDYEGPQRLVGYGSPVACGFMRQAGYLASNAIDESGLLVGQVSVTSFGPRPVLDCAYSIGVLHQLSEYVPAYHDGQPVSATYRELWGDYTQIPLE